MAPRVKNREPDGKLGKDIELSIQGSLFLLLVVDLKKKEKEKKHLSLESKEKGKISRF